MKNAHVFPGQSGFYVTITTSAGTTTKRVDGDVLTVGRAEDCDLTFAQDTLSRRHLTVSLRDGACWVEDHGSSNGTYVSGKRVKPHTPIRVLPEDVITMGQAGARLSFSTELLARKDSRSRASDADDQHTDTIVTSTNAARLEKKRSLQAVQAVSQAQAKPGAEAGEHAERLVQEAQKKAMTLIQNAEIEAERRVEDIYRRAHEAQAKADETYQKRVNEAFRAAEEIYQKSQMETQALLEKARHHSNEIRQQAENFVMELRHRTEGDCEQLLEDAQRTSRDLKEQRLLEADDLIKKKEEELIAEMKEVLDERMSKIEDDLVKEKQRARDEVERELNERKERFESEHNQMQETIAEYRADLQHYRELKNKEESDLREVEDALVRKREEEKRLDENIESARRTVFDFNQELSDLRTKIDRAVRKADDSGAKAKEQEALLARLNEEIKDAEDRVKEGKEQADVELLQMRAKLEEEKAKIGQREQSHYEELRLQSTRKVRDMERQLLEELQIKKDVISRELALVMETYVRENPNKKNFVGLQERISDIIEKHVTTITNTAANKEKQESFETLKRRQRFWSTTMGAVLGVSVLIGGEFAYERIKANQSPLQSEVAAIQEERRQDLEQRKFNPPQTRDFKSTYADNVVYTENFVSIYTSDDFQKKFMKSLSPYMFKTWKTDEDKVIQLLGITSTLVKTLSEKKENIHPDFVQQSLDKMKDTETETMDRIRQLLGSQVRVESFRKFEKQFFEKYVAVAPAVDAPVEQTPVEQATPATEPSGRRAAEKVSDGAGASGSTSSSSKAPKRKKKAVETQPIDIEDSEEGL